MASQSAHPGGDRNQDSALCSPIPSVRGAVEERLGASIWIAPYSGRPSISKTSCWSSGITSTMIAPITHWRGEHLIRTGRGHDRSPISTPTDGNLTVEACIRHPSLPDSRNTLLPRYPGSIRQGYTSANCSLFEFIGVARSADRIASLPSSAFTKGDSPHFRSAMSPRIGHRINSPETGTLNSRGYRTRLIFA